MATPIRNTPILFGKDARDFIAAAERQIPIEERLANRAKHKGSIEKLKALLDQKQ